MIKRTLDVTLSALALVILSPVISAIGVAIWCVDGAPVFYKQIRVGLDGQTFTIFKFRTMGTEAEKDVGPVWSIRNDPRPSRLGALLRRTALDELPQLVNVLKGEMSLVGPRPERPAFVRAFRERYRGYDQRHRVRPGLTGYAQIHGWRGATDLTERIRHDLYYVESYSLGLDLYILPVTLLRGWSERTRNGVG